MKIEVLELAGIIPSLRAMRLPKRSEPKSDRENDGSTYAYKSGNHIIIQSYTDYISDTDLALAERLVKAGDEHAKAMRGIVVWAEITAPIYWWREMETYRAGRERLSCESTMHIDCKGLSGEELTQAKAEIPMGKEQTAVDTFSYQTLRRIYAQRRHHRLPQWRVFCEWIEDLPFAAQLITCGL